MVQVSLRSLAVSTLLPSILSCPDAALLAVCDIDEARIALVFDKDTKELVQWVLHSPDGSELTFSLFDVEKGVDIPASYFYLNINDYNKIDQPS